MDTSIDIWTWNYPHMNRGFLYFLSLAVFVGTDIQCRQGMPMVAMIDDNRLIFSVVVCRAILSGLVHSVCTRKTQC
jgi:hypothetical protein